MNADRGWTAGAIRQAGRRRQNSYPRSSAAKESRLRRQPGRPPPASQNPMHQSAPTALRDTGAAEPHAPIRRLAEPAATTRADRPPASARRPHLPAARLTEPHAPVRTPPLRDAGAAQPHAPIRRPAEPDATTRAARPPAAPGVP